MNGRKKEKERWVPEKDGVRRNVETKYKRTKKLNNKTKVTNNSGSTNVKHEKGCKRSR